MKRPHLLRVPALLACSLGLHAALSTDPARSSDPLDEDLTRARVEQELMLAERTARMLSDLQEALVDWEAEPVALVLPDTPAEDDSSPSNASGQTDAPPSATAGTEVDR